jgi:hypothetical protein
MKEVKDLTEFEKLLSENNYSSEAIKEILKWYDFHYKKDIASF